MKTELRKKGPIVETSWSHGFWVKQPSGEKVTLDLLSDLQEYFDEYA